MEFAMVVSWAWATRMPRCIFMRLLPHTEVFPLVPVVRCGHFPLGSTKPGEYLIGTNRVAV
jgi:hypothetical protein